MTSSWAKIAVSVFALGAVVLRMVRPGLLEVTDLVILGVALLPWLGSLIKSAEFPGGLKIEFQDLADAAKKVTGAGHARPPGGEDPTFVQIASTDPNLAVVAVRIEIERRIRKLASQHGLTGERTPLVRLFEQLRAAGVLTDPVLSGLQELVMFGNQAAHGAEVETGAATWAVDYGQGVIAALDDALSE